MTDFLLFVQCVENTAAQVVTFLSDCVANPTSYMDMEAKLRIKAPVPDRWIPDDDRSVTTKSETSDMMDIVVEPHTGAQPPAGNPVMPSRPAPEEPAAKRPMRCKPAAFDLPPCPEYHPTVGGVLGTVNRPAKGNRIVVPKNALERSKGQDGQ